MQTVTAHGATIPVIGFGTWRLSGETCAHAVAEALRVGYRHIDGAAGYGNEDRVGEGIRASGVARDDIFITTKVLPEDLEDRAFQRSVDQSLEQLGIGQVDLVLIHWPSRALPVATTIASLNKAKERGAPAISASRTSPSRSSARPGRRPTRRWSRTSASTTPISTRTG